VAAGRAAHLSCIEGGSGTRKLSAGSAGWSIRYRSLRCASNRISVSMWLLAFPETNSKCASCSPWREERYPSPTALE
jgi:hypothetical protein